MALPTTGAITAAMINVELGRAATAPFNINGAAERALAGKPSGAISFADFRGKSSEIVVFATNADVAKDRMDLFFAAADWNGDVKKRLVIKSGTDFGATNRGHALATARTAGGTAESFGGELTLEIESGAFLSGRGGAANGGVGGNALFANLPGKNGQKLIVINNGTIRAGGGGGGAGGKGGTGGGGSVTTSGTTRQPTSGFTNNTTTYWTTGMVPGQPGQPPLYTRNVVWGGATIASGGNPDQSLSTRDFTHTDGWTYTRQNTTAGKQGVARSKASSTTTNTNGGAGGNGGNGGRGTGFGQALAGGSAGAAGANGGTNAGKGGTGGTGGAGGGWGASGSAGNPGAKGANGNRTNGANGAGGSTGGLAGFYCTNNANVVWQVTGTRQGRAG